VRLVLLAPLALATLPAAAANVASSPRPGQYRTTAELVLFEVPDVPETLVSQARNAFLEGLASGNDFCLAPDPASDAMRRKMLENIAEGDCSFSRFTAHGVVVSAAMSCTRETPDRGLVTIDGSIWAENADLNMNLEQDFEGIGATRIVVRARAARVGDC
jgi:hypothetical protein